MSPDFYMQKALDLAGQGLGTTWPNPMVGAVLVKNGKIIGEGFHHRSGENHAEINAFENATESPAGATLYVNLEPCCHLNKKTPPCAQRVIKEKISKVVISNLDPNPEVSGNGVKLLLEAGIEVETGVLESQGEKLNEVFFTAQRKKRPFIHLKLATTLDGMIALSTGESQWITGEKAREHAHRLRAHSQAILIGAGTLRRDDPKLNVRLAGFDQEQPWRIVLTKSGNLPQDRKLFQDELKDRTLVFNTDDLAKVMNEIFQRNIISVLVEGGARIASELLKAKLVDRISLYQNPSFLGSGLSALKELEVSKLSERIQLRDIESKWIGDDHYMTGRI